MTRPFRPSNHTHGEIFMADFCRKCWRMKEDGRSPCPILGKVLFNGIDDAAYPPEWLQEDDGTDARCTAFQDIREPEPRPRCTATLDMFA